MIPTPEQSAILDADQSSLDNFMINALAGTGKSATLKLLDRARHPGNTALYLVFNKRNQLEALEAQKEGAFLPNTKIKTFNGLGHGIWKDSIAHNITLDKDKMRNLWRQTLDDLTPAERTELWPQYGVVMDGLEKAKNLGYVPEDVKFPHSALIDRHHLHLAMDETPNEYAAQLIDELLTESITRAYRGTIDFGDQIYMPALFGGAFPRFSRTMVDEYQDQSPVNHALLRRLVKGRLIGVGDPNQNIYGFRGAKSGGMAAAVAEYGMTELPLSVSFRCPRAIVEAAQWRVPHFQWTKEGGNVRLAERFEHTEFGDDSVIICRNNAPLLRLAFRLISAGRSVSVVGSELGPRLVAVLKKLGDTTMPRRALLAAIEQWREERLLAGSKSAPDMADCMRVFAEHGDTLSQAISYAEVIFNQKGHIKLLTGHKSKGLEFDNVFFLDPGLLSEHEQDLNLRYVIQTRSQNKLTELDSSAISW